MNSNFYKYQTAILTIVLGILFSAVVFGQDEMTSVTRSELAGVNLPAGALRMNEASVPVEIDQALQTLIDHGGPKVRRGDTEVLVWTGKDVKKNSVAGMIDRVTYAFGSGGWRYEVSTAENGITFFTLLKDGADRRALIGVYGESDGTLMFAFTEMLAANSAARPASNTTVIGTGGSVSDYSFATPNGWTRSDSPAKITLTSENGENILVFLPPTDSSGDLAGEAERILWQVLTGFETWSGNGFQPDYGIFERGKTAQGLEYYRAYRYARRKGSGEYDMNAQIDANILLVKLGGKVAVVVGTSPFQTERYRDSSGTAIDQILYDLQFKSAKTSYDLKRELLGSWSTASSTVALAYTFNVNGTFDKGGAISFRTSYNATRDKVTTTSYGLTDRYSLVGNVITQTYKRTGEVSKYKIRIYETKYDKDPWLRKMGFLPVVDPDNGTIVFTRSN